MSESGLVKIFAFNVAAFISQFFQFVDGVTKLFTLLVSALTFGIIVHKEKPTIKKMLKKRQKDGD